MRGRLAAAAVAAALVVALPAAARAQCVGVAPGGPPGAGLDACVKATELFYLLAPQVGAALAGGNVMLGEGGALGGWGKRSLVLRASVVDGSVPSRVVPVSVSGPVASDFGAQRAPVPVPSLDLAVGLLRGVPVGLTNVGGVDLLVSATAVPNLTEDEVEIRASGGRVAVGLGARVGVLQESALVPGIALSYMRRRLPATSVRYTTANDSLGVLDTRFVAASWRLTANKHLGLFGIGGGVGRDRLDARTTIDAVVNETVQGAPLRVGVRVPDLNDATDRTTGFLNLTLGVPAARVVLEVGRTWTGDTRETTNRFGDRRLGAALTYGSLGVGVRF